MAEKIAVDAIAVPLGYPTSLIYLDESGARASGSAFFVVRRHGPFARSIKDVRDRHEFRGEFKFNEEERAVEFLADRQALVILDNCEHLVADAAELES